MRKMREGDWFFTS